MAAGDGGFEQNFKKLETLARELQDNKVTIDELVPKMKEALSSFKICKDVLKATRSQLTQLSAEFVELEKADAETEQ